MSVKSTTMPMPTVPTAMKPPVVPRTPWGTFTKGVSDTWNKVANAVAGFFVTVGLQFAAWFNVVKAHLKQHSTAYIVGAVTLGVGIIAGIIIGACCCRKKAPDAPTPPGLPGGQMQFAADDDSAVAPGGAAFAAGPPLGQPIDPVNL